MKSDIEIELEELQEDYKILEEKLRDALRLLYPNATPHEIWSMMFGNHEIK